MIVALIFLPMGWGLQQTSALVMTHLPHFKMQPEEQLPVRVLRVSMSLAGRATLGAAAILLAPVAEEILFRGILYPAIKQAGYPAGGLVGHRGAICGGAHEHGYVSAAGGPGAAADGAL